ncbi:MAG: hypothetical protein IJ716_07000 [Lachnospiraceae bacterium]|nr:hypothetical protein [Lachnospiraceae bacterium]
MAIEYTLLLKDKRLSKDVLIKKIESLSFSCSKVEQLAKGICINLNEEIGFSAFLLDAGNYPYNLWETTFFAGDFIFERTLNFRMVMEYLNFEKRYNVMLRILFDLATELNEDAILVSNWDTELCLFRKNKSIVLNNETGVWSNDCFKNIIVNRDVYYK